MTVSELIAELQKKLDATGDVEVYFSDSSGYPYEIDEVVLDEFNYVLIK